MSDHISKSHVSHQKCISWYNLEVWLPSFSLRILYSINPLFVVISRAVSHIVWSCLKYFHFNGTAYKYLSPSLITMPDKFNLNRFYLLEPCSGHSIWHDPSSCQPNKDTSPVQRSPIKLSCFFWNASQSKRKCS